MLCLSKKAEYALVALGHLAEQGGRYVSAREIAQANGLPLSLLMNLLKTLQGHGVLSSTRGIRGGYQIAANLESLSLHQLVAMTECHPHTGEECGCGEAADGPEMVRVARSHGPIQAVQFKLTSFLKQVRVADLVMPGRRIDVPADRLRIRENPSKRSLVYVDHVV